MKLFKKIIIIALPIVFAITATVAIAFVVSANQQRKEPVPSPAASENKPEDSDCQVNLPLPDDGTGYSQGLDFRANAEGGCAVVGLGSCADRIVRIPSQSPAGEPVTEIGSGAFLGATSVTEVILPSSVLRIGSGAFRGSGITTITIGSSVLSIGDTAFALCPSLSAIHVSEANAIYSSIDGVLFDKEAETLLCYPEGKSGTLYTIPKSVKKIASYALHSSKFLRELKYQGSKKQWNSVYICTENALLDRLPMSFITTDK